MFPQGLFSASDISQLFVLNCYLQSDSHRSNQNWLVLVQDRLWVGGSQMLHGKWCHEKENASKDILLNIQEKPAWRVTEHMDVDAVFETLIECLVSRSGKSSGWKQRLHIRRYHLYFQRTFFFTDVFLFLHNSCCSVESIILQHTLTGTAVCVCVRHTQVLAGPHYNNGGIEMLLAHVAWRGWRLVEGCWMGVDGDIYVKGGPWVLQLLPGTLRPRGELTAHISAKCPAVANGGGLCHRGASGGEERRGVCVCTGGGGWDMTSPPGTHSWIIYSFLPVICNLLSNQNIIHCLNGTIWAIMWPVSLQEAVYRK